MGCISSKQADFAASPALEGSGSASKSKAKAAASASAAAVTADNGGGSVVLSTNPSGLSRCESRKEEKYSDDHHRSRELKRPKKEGSNLKGSSTAFSFRLGFSHRYIDAEQTSAGWPTWLSAAAGEAIHGWVPLRADSFEKLEKVFLISC